MKVLAAILLLGLLGTLVWERSSLRRLKAQNESLRAQQREADRLGIEMQVLPKLWAIADLAGKRSDNIELLRLRNEVRDLRAQQREAGKLRMDNQRLADELRTGTNLPHGTAAAEQAGSPGK